MFEHLYGGYFKDKDENWRENGVLIPFDQREFMDYSIFKTAGLLNEGWIYYPNNCIGQDKKC